MNKIVYLLIPLMITIISELMCLLIFFPIFKIRIKKLFFIQIGMNCVTNISLNLILRLFVYNQYYIYILLFLELVIVIIEAIIYSIFMKNVKRGVMLSIICNIASYLIGTLFIY